MTHRWRDIRGMKHTQAELDALDAEVKKVIEEQQPAPLICLECRSVMVDQPSMPGFYDEGGLHLPVQVRHSDCPSCGEHYIGYDMKEVHASAIAELKALCDGARPYDAQRHLKLTAYIDSWDDDEASWEEINSRDPES